MKMLTSSGDDDGSSDNVGVHAGLRVVVEGDQSPVGDNTGDALLALEVFANDEVLDGGRVHHDDVRHREDLREDGRREERRVLDHDERALVLERYTELS